MYYSSLNMKKSQNASDLILRISSSMLSYDNIDDFFQNTVADVGNALNVHRVYIFSINGTQYKNIFSWVDPKLPEFVDLVDKVGYVQKAFNEDGMFENLKNGKPYILESIDKFEENARKILDGQHIKHLVLVPLFDNNQVTAFLGVDQCNYMEGWTKDILSTIESIGHILNSAMHYFDSLHLLKTKEEEAQALLDVLPFPVYITKVKDYKFIGYNKALGDYADISNIDKATCYEVMFGNDEPCTFCKDEHLTPHGEPYVWDLLDYKDKVDFKIIDNYISWGDVDDARLTILLDISDSLRLQKAQVLERESSLAKSRFLANMSHELRTPLNGIIGMTNLAIQNNQDDKVSKYLNSIKLSSKNLLEVVNGILDFSKLEAGKLELEQISFCPVEICKNIHEQLQDEAKLKEINLEYDIESNISKTLLGDGLRFAQIIYQLVKNAIKFTEIGKVQFTLKLHEVACDREILMLEVKDTGIGISKEDLQHLFIDFSQVDVSNSRRYGGTGLGLAIVEQLLDLMGGKIDVQSVVGEGTTFTCLIPFAKAEHEVYVEDIVEEANIEHTKILLAEDNEINTLIAYEMLRQRGCSVHCVENGYEVLEALEIDNYDIVLMDVQMPKMNGLVATEHIRKDVRFDNLPIIALTAHILKEEIDKCYVAGMQGHALKPIIAHDLCRMIAKYTQNGFKFERG